MSRRERTAFFVHDGVGFLLTEIIYHLFTLIVWNFYFFWNNFNKTNSPK